MSTPDKISYVYIKNSTTGELSAKIPITIDFSSDDFKNEVTTLAKESFNENIDDLIEEIDIDMIDSLF